MCAYTLGGGRCPVLPFDPISLVLAQRNGVEPPKKSAFLPRRLHHSRERYQLVDYTFLARLEEGVGGCLSPYLRRGERDWLWPLCAVGQAHGRHCRYQVPPCSKSAFLWGSTPFLCARAKKWGGTGRTSAVYCTGNGAHAKTAAQTGRRFFITQGACRRLSTRERWSISTARPG